MGNRSTKQIKTTEAKYAVAMEDLNNFLNKYPKSILQINSINGRQGTAAFYLIDINHNYYYCLITAYHVLNTADPNEIARAHLEFDNEMPFRLNPELIISVVHNSLLDAIVIEIAESYAKHFKSQKMHFFSINAPDVENKVEI